MQQWNREQPKLLLQTRQAWNRLHHQHRQQTKIYYKKYMIRLINDVNVLYLSWFEVTSGFSTNSNSDSSSRFTIAVATVSPLNKNVMSDCGFWSGSLWIWMVQNHRRYLLSFHLAFSIVLKYHINGCKCIVAYASWTKIKINQCCAHEDHQIWYVCYMLLYCIQ